VEPWSADDPWQERRDPSPGWDEWPPPAPSADAYAVDEPGTPASDPWAESWADEVPGIPTSPPPELYAEPASDAGFEPSPTSTLEPSDLPSAPSFESPYDEPGGEVEFAEAESAEPDSVEAEYGEAEPQSFGSAEPAAAPRIEPWSPDSDPWGAAWMVPPVVEAAVDEEPVADAAVAEEQVAEAPAAEEAAVLAEEQIAEAPAAEEAAVLAEEQVAEEPVTERAEERVAEESRAEGEISIGQPELGADMALAASSTDGWRAPEPEPEVEAEPPLTDSDLGNDEPTDADAAIAAMVAGAAVEGAVDEEPSPAQGDARDDEPTFADAAMAATAAALAGVAIREEPSSDAASTGDAWEGDAEPAVAAELEPPAEPAFPPPVWAQEPAPAPEGAESPELAGEAADAEAEAEPVESWEADLWSEPEPAPELEPAPAPELAAAVAAGQPRDADRDSAENDESRVPDAAIAAAAITASEPYVEARRPDVPWLDRPDQTEVFPTTWEPPPPPPPADREEAGSAEPRTGEIRTKLGQAEPDLDDELAEEPTTAEAAVPWLIGVILLLAGMVIVLLALIFAGDASLGGGADASPTPPAAAIVPGPSGALSAASPTPRSSPSPSPDPSNNPDGAVPKYGDLEMIYQGRSAALAPIYLLRRDFSVEGDPEVMARDDSLDVRRFAWSPNGSRGAFLYADVLVAIDPGVDVHRLSDGISAITFGNGPATVYAVRVVADGGNDVASILAVDHATGKERELDRVSYPRPALEEEVALAEAQFSDDGGSVRLYWMHDDTLRLWILGGGTWTVDPEEGNASKLDEEALPVLWAPEGERRIRLAIDGDKTRLNIVDRSGDQIASTNVTGRVSHLRWSPRGDQVVFTLGRPTSGGGVLQDLYLWNLGAGEDPAPTMITNTGAAFGAEWRGSQNRWEED
jgi:hypothetical protein